MINVSTATPDEIVSEAIAILQSVKKHDMSQLACAEYMEWLCAMIIRLSNDLNGRPHPTEEDEKRNIQHWAELTAKLFGTK